MRALRKGGLGAIALLLAAGCGGDSPTDLIPTGNMAATVDGGAWSAAHVEAVRSGGTVAVSGADVALIAVGFAFPDQGPGTYDIGPGEGSVANVTEGGNSWSANTFQGSGTITVASLTADAVAGTFAFTADFSVGTGSGTRTVTNGTFNVSF